MFFHKFRSSLTTTTAALSMDWFEQMTNAEQYLLGAHHMNNKMPIFLQWRQVWALELRLTTSDSSVNVHWTLYCSAIAIVIAMQHLSHDQMIEFSILFFSILAYTAADEINKRSVHLFTRNTCALWAQQHITTTAERNFKACSSHRVSILNFQSSVATARAFVCVNRNHREIVWIFKLVVVVGPSFGFCTNTK